MPLPRPSSTDPLQWLDRVLQSEPQRTLLRTPDGRHLSYREFHELSGSLATALATCGVVCGERVAAQVEKSVEAVALYIACLRIGAVFVPLNSAYTLAELEYFLRDCQPRVAIVRPQMLTGASPVARAAGVAHIETMDEQGGGSLLTLAMNPGNLGFTPFSGDATALAALLYTSGTTGRSKGAMLTRGNLASNAVTLFDAWQFSETDVLLHALPIFHVHGLFVAINLSLASGSSMLFLPKFDANEIVRLLPQATVMMGVPTFYTRLLQHPGLTEEAASRVRVFISGSAPLLAETHREFRRRTGHAILERYGMSETLMNTSNPYDGERVPGSVGPALPAVEIRISDAESGQPLSAPGAIGMIEVRGPNVFAGYWRMPEKTAAEFRADGFFITGDLGMIDARGYVRIVGRGKDLIITGGYNVYPIEVEAEIDALPGVIESAVIGVPHADFGEAVTAIIVRSPSATLDESAVRQQLEQRLANFKLPKRALFIDELPRNTMGKVQKSALRERYRELYGERKESQ
ncbi:MAG TPA: malonyl-CoA synthase [Steroidobacteraceae bacterium]|jgi:malonyl-CoA/methylmalonyl-CoA synthetase